MTAQDYKNKVDEMEELSQKLYKTQKDKERLMDLVADIPLYEANHGLLDENEYK